MLKTQLVHHALTKKIKRNGREFVDNCLEFMCIAISGNTVWLQLTKYDCTGTMMDLWIFIDVYGEKMEERYSYHRCVYPDEEKARGFHLGEMLRAFC